MNDFSAKCSMLSEIAAYRIEEICDSLECGLKRYGKMLAGPCPVHGGKNAAAFNLYLSGHSTLGNYICNTRGCQKVTFPSSLGFIRGRLSHIHLGYDGQNKRELFNFKKTVDWTCDFLRVDWSKLKVDHVAQEKSRFIGNVGRLSRTPIELPAVGWSPAMFRERVEIPSPYFMKRGFSAEMLKQYDIGDSKATTPANPMYGRAVVPIFDQHHAKILGVSGRSLSERCGKCERFHNECLPCPTVAQLSLPSFAKWRNEGFDSSAVLYGLWFAVESIKRTRTVILVEGPLDVLRLNEAGIFNAVGILGVSLTDRQQILLEMSDAMKVVLALDNDEAGIRGTANALDKLEKLFTIKVVRPEAHDWGETAVSDVRKAFGSV